VRPVQGHLLGRHEPIKFTTLFGLLAVELAITLDPGLSHFLAAVFFLASTVFVYRSFYAMRIKSE
jgi:K(+)-stimulated pyrophosphate-energized sodium pump